MKQSLSLIDIETIIFMAWADTIPFETIYSEYGLREGDVKKLMRTHQSAKTYTRWRERVTARRAASSKHATRSHITSTKTKY